MILEDAVKGKISMRGYALLQWEFNKHGIPMRSAQMQEEIVDKILEWRDEEKAKRKKDD